MQTFLFADGTNAASRGHTSNLRVAVSVQLCEREEAFPLPVMVTEAARSASSYPASAYQFTPLTFGATGLQAQLDSRYNCSVAGAHYGKGRMTVRLIESNRRQLHARAMPRRQRALG